VPTRYRPEAGGTEFLVYTADRDDLFAVLTGGFESVSNLTIMDARIHTTRFGFALEYLRGAGHAMQPVERDDARTLAQLASGRCAKTIVAPSRSGFS